MDLYGDLGLGGAEDKPSIPAAAIKAAYRKASTKAHPDKPGGSVDKFARVKFAYDVLSDPERRARYDATGEADPSEPDITRARAMENIAGVLFQLIDTGVDDSMLGPNIIENLKINTKNCGEQIAKGKKAVATLERLAGKIKRKDGTTSEIGITLTTALSSNRSKLLRAEKELVGLKMAIEIVKGHEFGPAELLVIQQLYIGTGFGGSTA